MTPQQALERHGEELGRAAAAAMARQYQEAVEICSELLTGEIHTAMSAEDSRRARAETRLLLATAMHYNEAHHDDIARVLQAALDAPAEVRKDVWFTLAVIEASAGETNKAREAMEQCLAAIAGLRAGGTDSADLEDLNDKEAEAREFLRSLAPAGTLQ